MQGNVMKRRTILKTAAASWGFQIVPRHVLGGPNFVAPSEKINIAIIGAGGQGRQNCRQLLQEKDAQIIAVADPMASVSLERFYFKGMGGREPVIAEIEEHYAKQTPNYRCAGYEDFRVMLEKGKSIDAVLCATPDHLHAYVSVMAMRQGKHVYCEKPLAHNIWETRMVAQVARETGLATQLGNQGHSREGIRQTVEYLRDGAIGPVRQAHAWVPTNRWNPGLEGIPADTPPVPAGLNWDLWLGPREVRPYHPAYVPVAWRDFWAFGCGALGDFGCHDLDAIVWAYELHAPDTIEAFPAGFMNDDIAPYGENCYYRFPASGQHPPLQVTWHAGGLKPARPDQLPEGMSLPRRGVLLIGEKGIIQCDGAGGAPRLFPDELRKTYQPPAKTLPRSNGHHRDWLDAIKGGPQASSHFEYGARLTEITLLGILALRAGKQCHWDAQAMQVTNFPEADAIIKENYRKGWEIV
jgi:predicted dehydrogenase